MTGFDMGSREVKVFYFLLFPWLLCIWELPAIALELVSDELNLFGVIADLFRQIGGRSSRFVLFALFEDFSL
jgi:hypothetical protein